MDGYDVDVMRSRRELKNRIKHLICEREKKEIKRARSLKFVLCRLQPYTSTLDPYNAGKEQKNEYMDMMSIRYVCDALATEIKRQNKAFNM